VFRSYCLSQREACAFALIVLGGAAADLQAADIGNPPMVSLTERADPSRDARVAALLSQQAAAAQRLGEAQVGNVQGRLQQLHGDDAAFCDRPEPRASRAAAAAGSTAPLESATLSSPRGPVPTVVGSHIALPIVPSAADAVSLPLGACQRSHVGTAWSAGSLDVGTPYAPVSGQGLALQSRGVTFGADHRIARDVVLGVGIGLARERADAVGDGVWNGTDAQSATVYLGYRPSPDFFIDALAGAGDLQMRSARHAAEHVDAAADRSGAQRFASLAAGSRLDVAGVAVAPYTRLDAIQATLQPTVETDGGSEVLRYPRQSAASLKAVLGVEGSSRIETRFGALSPRVKAEMSHEFDGAGAASLVVADSTGGPSVAIDTVAVPRSAWSAGFGAALALRDHWSVGAGYAFDRSAAGSVSRLDFTLTRQLR